MPITTDFETQLRGPWDTASGFLVEQLELLQAQIAPVYPLILGIQNTANATAANAIVGITGYPANTVMISDPTATPSFSSALPMPLAFLPGTVTTPPPLSVATNDYAPTNVQTAAVLRVSATAAVALTGMLGAQTTPHSKLLINIGAQTITLSNNSASSSAGNRWRCPGVADFALTAGRGIWIWYDMLSAVWQVVS
jgi:hypothetical protein